MLSICEQERIASDWCALDEVKRNRRDVSCKLVSHGKMRPACCDPKHRSTISPIHMLVCQTGPFNQMTGCGWRLFLGSAPHSLIAAVHKPHSVDRCRFRYIHGAALSPCARSCGCMATLSAPCDAGGGGADAASTPPLLLLRPASPLQAQKPSHVTCRIITAEKRRIPLAVLASWAAAPPALR